MECVQNLRFSNARPPEEERRRIFATRVVDLLAFDRNWLVISEPVPIEKRSPFSILEFCYFVAKSIPGSSSSFRDVAVSIRIFFRSIPVIDIRNWINKKCVSLV